MQGRVYFPVFISYPETALAARFETEALYRDPYLKNLIAEKGGFALWPMIRFSYNTINYDLTEPAPSPPSSENWLGTDDQGRDVLARMIYGFRISSLFGLTLTLFSSLIGIGAGAVQAYFGGKLDLVMQRFMEVWGGCRFCISSSSWHLWCSRTFVWLLILMLLFSWMSLVAVCPRRVSFRAPQS
jgi:microcin C transport system permease protein